MQKVRIILVLVSVLTLLTPFAVVGITYRNNPVQMVVPPQIKQIIGSSSSSNSGSGNGNFISGDITVSSASPTNTFSIQLTNPFNFSVTLYSLNATVTTGSNNNNNNGNNNNGNNNNGNNNNGNNNNNNNNNNGNSNNNNSGNNNTPLGTIASVGFVNMGAAQTVTVDFVFTWAPSAESAFQTQNPIATSINVNLINLTINISGITVQMTQPSSATMEIAS
jgi:hypothetical protein